MIKLSENAITHLQTIAKDNNKKFVRLDVKVVAVPVLVMNGLLQTKNEEMMQSLKTYF